MSFYLPSLLCLIFAFVVFLDIADGAETRLRTTPRCAIESRGVHKCPVGAPQERGLSSLLDPRAETGFITKIPVSESFMKYEFNATYWAPAVKRTTIAQMLNFDESDSDLYKPVLFVVAWTKSNGKLKVCMHESCQYVWEDVPFGFRLRLKTSGNQALLSIGGRPYVSFDLVRTLNGGYRPRGTTELRWGVYHHDVSDGNAASAAHVRVYDISSRGF